MFLFLLSIFPLGFLIWLCLQKNEERVHFLFVAFWGLFLGAVFCVYKFFFSPFYYLAQDSFFSNFIYYFLWQFFFPLAILTAIFLLSKKRVSISTRFANLFPFYAGFFSVFVPFSILSAKPPYMFFSIFLKPILYFFVILFLPKVFSIFFAKQNRDALSAKKKIVFLVTFVLLFFLPASFEAALLQSRFFLL